MVTGVDTAMNVDTAMGRFSHKFSHKFSKRSNHIIIRYMKE
jgi:hypothetical protein